jgi:predicted permease
MMRRDAVFTLLAVLTLALGIGANTAIFSVINTLMLRPLPVHAPDQLVELLSRYPGEPRVNGFAWKVYEHYRDNNTVLASLIATSSARFRVGAERLDVENVEGEYVVGQYFPMLAVRAASGRLIGPDDDRLGSPTAAVAVLSWPYWQSRFNLDPGIVGKSITVSGVQATVIGVADQEFFGLQLGATPGIWVPTAMAPLIQAAARRPVGIDQLGVRLLGRLKPGVTLEQANAEMRVLDRWRIDEIAKTSPDPQIRRLTLDVESASTGFSTLRQYLGRPLLVLMIVVALVLLLACINVATMLLARGAAREREMAVRVSVGAGRFRLLRQVLTESMTISAVAGACGILIAYWGANMIVRTATSGRPIIGMPAQLDISVAPDRSVFMFTAAVALLTGLLFGLVPAIRAFATAPVTSLRTGGETKARRFFSNGLVLTQVVLSVVLLSAAALFVAHLSNLRSMNLGFQPDSVLLVRLDAEGSGLNRQMLTARSKQLLQRLEQIPGVRSTTLGAMTPVSGAAWSRVLHIPGFEERAEGRRTVLVNNIAPRYFETVGIRLLSGRDFQLEDESRPRVAIVNEALVQQYFGSTNPIGRPITFDNEPDPYEVIGIVAGAKELDLHQPAPQPAAYIHAFQDGRIATQYALRTTVKPTAVAGEVRRAVREVLQTVRISSITTLSEQVDASIMRERVLAALSGLFGGLGAVLVAIGLYGLLSYAVARRTSEIGIRMALGATRGDVMRMVLRHALTPVCIGLAIGAPLALAGQRAIDRYMNLSVDGIWPIAVAAGVMIGVAFLAGFVPARRAARVEPRDALRYE